MQQIDQHVLTASALTDLVECYRRSPDYCDQHFGAELAQHASSRSAFLTTLPGRITRSCLLDLYDIVRGCLVPCTTFATHMCFITRNSIASIDRRRLTPSAQRTYDGYDELQPQRDYINDWNFTPDPAQLLQALSRVSPESREEGLVRSFRCFSDAYFEAHGTFVVQFPADPSRDVFSIVSGDQLDKSRPLVVPSQWALQEDLDSAIVAFCKFFAAKYRVSAHAARGDDRTLYLLAVGSHALPRGLAVETAHKSKSTLLSTIQSAWIVISVPSAEAGGGLITRLAVGLPQLDSAMTSCLALNLMHQQEGAIQALMTQVAEHRELRELVRRTDKSFRAYERRVDPLFRSVAEPSERIRRLAHDLQRNVLATSGEGSTYESPTTPGGRPSVLHREGAMQSGFTDTHASDLRFWMDRHLSASAIQRFLKHDKATAAHLESLKRCVYKLCIEGELETESYLTVGMLRAALLWQLQWPPTPVAANGAPVVAADFDAPLIPMYRLRSVIERPLDFVLALAAAVQAWLEPSDSTEPRIATAYERFETLCTFTLWSDDSVRSVDHSKIVELAGAIDLQRPAPALRSGSLTRALREMLIASHAGTRPVPQVAAVTWKEQSGKELQIPWALAAQNVCSVSLIYDFDPANAARKAVRIHLSL